MIFNYYQIRFPYLPLSALLLVGAAHANDYPSCLSEKLKGIANDAAVKAIIEACQAQYPDGTAGAANNSKKALIDNRYQDNGNGTITDTSTNLTWMRCSLGQRWNGISCIGTKMELTLDDALKTTAKYSYAGHSDWRMPTISQLDTLVKCPGERNPVFLTSEGYDYYTNGYCIDDKRNNPHVNINAFPNMPFYWYWSSTPFDVNPNYFWTVNFISGNTAHLLKQYKAGVLLVRYQE